MVLKLNERFIPVSDWILIRVIKSGKSLRLLFSGMVLLERNYKELRSLILAWHIESRARTTFVKVEKESIVLISHIRKSRINFWRPQHLRFLETLRYVYQVSA